MSAQRPTAGPRTVRARAFASFANVGHGFDAFGLAVSAGSDRVELSIGGRDLDLIVRGRAADEAPSAPEQNTAGLALRALQNATGIRDPLRVVLTKGTRAGSGLGSSAASAAAAAVAFDALHELHLSREQLVLAAAEGERAAAGAAHTDNVAAAIYGGFVIFSAAGTIHIEPPAALRFVFALPEIALTTKAARQALPPHVSLAEFSRGAAAAAMTAVALERGDLRAFGRMVEGAFHERCRAPLVPGFDAVCTAARAAGAYGATISGSGPTVAAILGPECNAERIAAGMRAAFAAAGFACETIVCGAAPGAHVLGDEAAGCAAGAESPP